jgi:hypothetical protein
MSAHEDKVGISTTEVVSDTRHIEQREEEALRAAKSFASMNSIMYALAFWGMSASIGYAFG